MLVNALTREELRIAILDGNTLEHFQIEVSERGLIRGNIYRGTVANVQPALSAAFVDFGAEKHGFLPFHDIVEEQYHRRKEGAKRIEQVLEKGRSILVQASREAEGQKGAALTTNISLAGRYLVFTPWDEMRGVSRKVEDEAARRKLKEQISDFKVPEGAGLIARTNAVGQTKVDLRRDLAAILRTWKTIQADAKKGSGPALLHSDQDIVLRVMRDYVDASIDEIIIDDRHAWEAAKAYAERFMPRTRTEIRLWEERAPLFTRYDLEPKIEQIHARTVPLRNGGSIVIDHTEALVAIDVNSGRTKGSNQEETAAATNMEAAREVARQLRLRDIGGLIVVDFIDMRSRKHRNDVLKTLRDEMKSDKARSTVGSISPNGLVEINRQRIQQALHLRTSRPCPTCDGSGRIASPEMIGLNLLRRIEGRALTGTLESARIALHPEIADAFQNGRRAQLAALESEFGIRIEIIAASGLHRPEQEIEWIERPRGSVAALPPLEQKQQQTPAAQAEAENGGRKRKRRRRKKHGAESTDLSAAGLETADADLQDHDEEEISPAADTDEQELSEASATGRRKRRRRRRRGGGTAAVELLPELTDDEEIEGEDLPSAWVWDDQPESEAAAPVARELDDDSDFDDFDDSVLTRQAQAPPTEDAAEKPHRKRRRRRRGGSRTAATASDAGSATDAVAEPVPQPSVESTAEPEAADTGVVLAADAEPALTPAKRPARKRPARRKTKTAAAAAPNANAETEKADVPAAENAGGEPVANEAKPKRKTRSRRKKPTAAENSQSDSDGE